MDKFMGHDPNDVSAMAQFLIGVYWRVQMGAAIGGKFTTWTTPQVNAFRIICAEAAFLWVKDVDAPPIQIAAAHLIISTMFKSDNEYLASVMDVVTSKEVQAMIEKFEQEHEAHTDDVPEVFRDFINQLPDPPRSTGLGDEIPPSDDSSS